MFGGNFQAEKFSILHNFTILEMSELAWGKAVKDFINLAGQTLIKTGHYCVHCGHAPL